MSQEGFAEGVANDSNGCQVKSNGATHRSWAGERLFTLRDLSRELCRMNDPPVVRSHWALYRWAKYGVVIYGTKKRVRLAHTVICGARHSSVQAVIEFWTALSNARFS